MFKNMNVKAVLFDLYNTLIEIQTDEGRHEVWETLARFLRYRGLRADAEHMYNNYFSQVELSKNECPEEHAEVDVVEIFGRMLNEMGHQGAPSFPEEVTQLFRALSVVRFGTFPDTIRSLEALKQKFILGLISDAQRAFFDPEVAMTGLHSFMDVIVVSSDYGYRKPDPRLFFKALEILRLPAEQAVYVGDNVERDICGAKNAGMEAILINRTGQQDERDNMQQPDKIFRSLDEAKTWLLG
jgi:putative hydrolase of the HAD superfamily